MKGCDDIQFSIDEKKFDLKFLKALKQEFYKNSSYTLSIGVEYSIKAAIDNLRIAKYSGKNLIIDSKI